MRRGISLVYLTVMLVVLFAFVSLGVDYGRVQLVKTELQRSADSAARYAARGLYDGTFRARARQAAVENRVDGVALDLRPEDVLVGNWDPSKSPRFDPNRGPVNALEVTAQVNARRGNAVPLLFARAIGFKSFNASAKSVVFLDSDRVGIVGLDWIDIKGGARIDSFDPRLGPYSTSKSSLASVTSNGDILLANNTIIEGNAHPGVGRRVIGGTVTGSTTPRGTPLNLPPVSAGSFTTNNNNSAVPPQYLSGGDFRTKSQDIVTLPGGTYYFNTFTMSGGSSLILTGPVTFYIAGSIDLSGRVSTLENKAENFAVKMVGSGKADLSMSGGSGLYVSLYGPTSPITVNGGGNFYGNLIGKNITITGMGQIHDDLSLITVADRVVMVQ